MRSKRQFAHINKEIKKKDKKIEMIVSKNQITIKIIKLLFFFIFRASIREAHSAISWYVIFAIIVRIILNMIHCRLKCIHVKTNNVKYTIIYTIRSNVHINNIKTFSDIVCYGCELKWTSYYVEYNNDFCLRCISCYVIAWLERQCQRINVCSMTKTIVKVR